MTEDGAEVEPEVESDDEPTTFYTEERWHNWLERVRDEDLDPEDEDSARLLLNLQDDVAVAVAKVLTAAIDGRIDDATAAAKLERIREIVLSEPALDEVGDGEGEPSEEAMMLVDGVQTSLVPVLYAAEEYLAAGASDEATIAEYLDAAAEAAEEDVDAALGYVVQAGTRVVDGDELAQSTIEGLEYGIVAEWANGLDSLQNALADPEVVEEE